MASLQGQTKGLLLTGGEPTSSPLFADVVRMARKHGFLEIAVVTNGTLLHKNSVVDALVTYASTIRISLYDWDADSFSGINPVLDRIESLRKKIDREGSQLQIGVSALTSKEKKGILFELADSIRSAGAHWIYFHPTCTGWNFGRLAQVNQEGVLEEIENYQKSLPPADGFEAFVSRDRYLQTQLEFDTYHAAHFLLVIGADGLNYLGPEVKYQPQHVLSDVAGNWRGDFLWQRERLKRIRAVKSNSYPGLKSRHRGVFYNDFIERMLCGRLSSEERSILRSPQEFRFPHIL